MKITLIAPRAAVDLLDGRCEHHAVLMESGDWLVVASIHDADLLAQVRVAAGIVELPHPNSGAALPQAALDSLVAPVSDAPVGDGPIVAEPPAPAPANTRDFVQQVVERRGMPVLLQFLDR